MAAGGLGVAGGTAVLAGVFGSAGVALSARAIHIRTAGISEFAFDSLGGTGLLNIIAISGWLSQRDDFRKHWAPLTDLAPMANRYALRWESKHLLKLGTAIGVTCTAQASCQAAAFWAKQATRFAGRQLLWPAIVVEAINFIDNPWHVATDRAEKTGIELAEQLVERSLGRLPGILIGFSLGGRVIMSCLRHLAAGNHAGIVSDVVLMGAAVSPCENEWKDAQSVVAGRLVNAYCNTD